MDENNPLQQFLSMFPPGSPFSPRYHPALDMAFVADSFIIRLDVPGLRAEDISIRTRTGLLSISGVRKDDLAGEGVRRLHHERPFSPFAREVHLPENAVLDEIVANCAHGVLTITVPLQEPEEMRDVEVGEA